MYHIDGDAQPVACASRFSAPGAPPGSREKFRIKKYLPPIMPRGAPRMKMLRIFKSLKIFPIFPVIDWGKFLIFFSLPKNAGQYKI
jgi:hypothetical protein